MTEYATPTFRKSRKEDKLKRRFRVYKRGGSKRTLDQKD